MQWRMGRVGLADSFCRNGIQGMTLLDVWVPFEESAQHADGFSEIKGRSDSGDRCSLQRFLKTKADTGDQGKIHLARPEHWKMGDTWAQNYPSSYLLTFFFHYYDSLSQKFKSVTHTLKTNENRWNKCSHKVNLKVLNAWKGKTSRTPLSLRWSEGEALLKSPKWSCHYFCVQRPTWSGHWVKCKERWSPWCRLYKPCPARPAPPASLFSCLFSESN